MMHRSTSWFERCYAADFDARIRSTEKHACWVAWLDHYTDGQPPERIGYAQERIRELGDGRSTIALPGLEAAVGPAYATDGVAPADGAAGTTPPPPADTNAIPPPPPPHPPAMGNAACGPVCDPRWNDCVLRCDHLRPDPCLDACMVEYRACSRGCF